MTKGPWYRGNAVRREELGAHRPAARRPATQPRTYVTGHEPSGTAIVMKRLDYAYACLVSYQSEVGPVRWLGPRTQSVTEHLAGTGRRRTLVMPIAFTRDPIETLRERDIAYGKLAHDVGTEAYRRAPALNGLSSFRDAVADVVATHLSSGEACTRNEAFRCPGCVNPECRNILNPVAPYAPRLGTPRRSGRPSRSHERIPAHGRLHATRSATVAEPVDRLPGCAWSWC